MPSLILSNNSASNPQTLDLSNYLRLQPDQGTDPADAAFSEKIWGRSILREGATLALEQVVEKELLFPLALKGTTASVVSGTLVQQINQIITTAGATVSWQDDGMSQPTVFDLLSGQVDIEYSYFRGKQAWCNCKMRLFTQPYGRTASPRLYATASGVGPLLVISPYASGGGQVIGASTQAGVAGFGGAKQGGVPSGGVFYWGSPSLAGDAPAMLQVSYVGPQVPGGIGQAGVIPYVALAILPDQQFQPLATVKDLGVYTPGAGAASINSSTAVASQYLSFDNVADRFIYLLHGPDSYAMTDESAGPIRVFAIARASATPGTLTSSGALASRVTTASVLVGDWQPYDLGTFTPRPSQVGTTLVGQGFTIEPKTAASSAVDVTALVLLPDNRTTFLNPTSIVPSQVGWPANPPPAATWSNTLLWDDVLGATLMFGSTVGAPPSPVSAAALGTPLSQYTRGLIPRPEPKNGLPIIAILGVGQWYYASTNRFGGASWANAQNLRTLAQVTVLERTRFELP